jgi:hypothetical protein
VRPAALGSARFASVEEKQEPTLSYHFFHWALGFTLVYAMVFGVGNLLFGRTGGGIALIALSWGCCSGAWSDEGGACFDSGRILTFAVTIWPIHAWTVIRKSHLDTISDNSNSEMVLYPSIFPNTCQKLFGDDPCA